VPKLRYKDLRPRYAEKRTEEKDSKKKGKRKRDMVHFFPKGLILNETRTCLEKGVFPCSRHSLPSKQNLTGGKRPRNRNWPIKSQDVSSRLGTPHAFPPMPRCGGISHCPGCVCPLHSKHPLSSLSSARGTRNFRMIFLASR
jgi:hypothetical protein